MRRVIVESPFAPRTPLAEGQCANAPDECSNLLKLGRHRKPVYDQHRLCPVCAIASVRVQETLLHQRYLAACLRDCILRGETPYASHRLLTMEGVLRDEVPEERELGIRDGFAWRAVAHASVFYVDLGWSGGMQYGLEDAKRTAALWPYDPTPPPASHSIEERTLGGDWAAQYDRIRAAVGGR